MTAEEDRLRRCTHHTMRVRGEPCAHWECVERNKAADRIEELEQWIDTIVNPKSESGHCFFCQHRIGHSVFAPYTADPAYHEDDCIWMKRQSPGANAG